MLDPRIAEQIYPPLRARAFELTRRDNTADDLTQATLLELLERPPAREGTARETLHYARLRMHRVFLRRFVGAPRRPALSVLPA
jgi:DNA-directed RNA polymerase specialized sigma24 family protein